MVLFVAGPMGGPLMGRVASCHPVVLGWRRARALQNPGDRFLSLSLSPSSLVSSKDVYYCCSVAAAGG
jgi:hypothetical protein